MNPPPPMPHDCGRATLSAKTVAAAASTALPPASRIPRPTRAAAGDSVAMTPRVPVTPGWNWEPCWACAGMAATASRARVRAMTVRSTAGVLPLLSGSCAEAEVMYCACQPHSEHHPGDQAGDGWQHVGDRFVAQDAREALSVLDVARGGRRDAPRERDENAGGEAERRGDAKGQVGDGVRAVPLPACLHCHEHRTRAREALDRDRASQRFDELLELIRRPALERLAERL